MSKISDEIRQLRDVCCDDCVDKGCCDEMRALANRIDAEMVELPRDRDGVPIHVGDAMCLEDGREAIVNSIYLLTGTQGIAYLVSGRDLLKREFSSFPICITHKQTDSLERIADELDEMVDAASHADDTCEKLSDIALRIRKLAKEQANE